jgi:DNA-binding NtrC family response regulator
MINIAATSNIVVLIVEDEALIRLVLSDSLTESGFEVIEAVHAADAVRLLGEHAVRVHALFTDVHMPGEMNGLALAHHTCSNWPWISILITSGRAYPEADHMPAGALFVAKPYDLGEITRHIRKLVGTL